IFEGKDPDQAAKWFVEKILESIRDTEKSVTVYTKPNPKAKIEREVWVYFDHIGSKPNIASIEIMSEARRIADLLSTKMATVIVGDELDELVDLSFEYGADKVYYARVKGYSRYDNEVYTHALATMIRKYKPEIIFFPGTRSSRELASSTAIEVDTGLAADCTMFDVDEKGILYATRPDFGGKEMSTIICPNHKPYMITVRPGVFSPLPKMQGRKGELIREEINAIESRLKVIERREIIKTNVLTTADVVVGVGRGIRSPENIKLAEELAELLNGVVGVTKPLADMGWYPKERQIGQTGNTIRPKLYIALGISGAVQHLVGISASKKIGAINIDRSSPIFDNCDFGVVGDLFEIVPRVIKILKEVKKNE
ncbi:MAG: electron transfer flavoprotein subunit alpha/FixB family protein, partial [Sulfolobales archaeon]